MRRWLFVVLVVGWWLTGLVGAAVVSFALYVDDLLCEHETGDSDFGDASRSWWPLGTQCTWTEPPNLVTDHEDPSWGPTAFTVVYVALGVALASEARGRRRRQGTGGSPQHFDTPEQAALAGWSPAAGARVISVDRRGADAEVLLQVGPGYPDYVHCFRTQEGWVAGSSANGHVVDWDAID